VAALHGYPPRVFSAKSVEEIENTEDTILADAKKCKRAQEKSNRCATSPGLGRKERPVARWIGTAPLVSFAWQLETIGQGGADALSAGNTGVTREAPERGNWAQRNDLKGS
jgi:hypothetical protein